MRPSCYLPAQSDSPGARGDRGHYTPAPAQPQMELAPSGDIALGTSSDDKAEDQSVCATLRSEPRLTNPANDGRVVTSAEVAKQADALRSGRSEH